MIYAITAPIPKTILFDILNVQLSAQGILLELVQSSARDDDGLSNEEPLDLNLLEKWVIPQRLLEKRFRYMVPVPQKRGEKNELLLLQKYYAANA